MTIREVSERTGISSNNLRFYEKIGLIPPVPRKASGVREYNEELLAYINFVMQFKKANVSLEAIIAYVHLAAQGGAAISEQQKLLQETRKNLASKIRQMEECLQEINLRIENCRSDAARIKRDFSGLWSSSAKEMSA